MFCHGYEERGQASVGVLATGAVTAEVLPHMVPMSARFASRVNIYTDGNPSCRATFHSSKVHWDDRKIASYALENGQGPGVVITFEDGSTTTEGFCVGQPKMVQRAPFAKQLGLEMEGEDVKAAPPFFETSVPGCFSAGDSGTPMKAAMQAMYMGGMACAGMIFQLQADLDATDKL